MKLSMECDVDSNTLLNSAEDVEFDGSHYMFLPDDKGFLAKIRIIRPIETPERFFYLFDENEQGTISGLRGGGDPEVYDRVIEEFQQLESMLAYSVEIRNVHWESPTYMLIPETDQERERVHINSLKVSPGRRPPAVLGSAEVRTIVRNRETYKQLTVVQGFWREGRNDYDDGQYIDAFANFYYILEDRYAPGIADEKLVLRRFKASDELRTFVQAVINSTIANPPDNHQQVVAMLSHRQKQYDVDGVLYLLCETRGEVHHFVEKSRRVYGNPFRNRHYGGIALIALMLTVMVIHARIIDVRDASRKPSSKNEGK